MQSETAHVDTVLLHRSARTNKYDGFRVPPVSDKRAATSKVKPRKHPFVPCSSSACGPKKVSHVIPPPTSILAIQSIGTNMCGLHPSQLSKRKLLSSQAGQKSDTVDPDAV